nr:PREDICTED: tigger transposable element-derived protein 1-like [Megachile rotundata]
MSETQLLWQALPINTSTEKQTKNIRDYELRKNRITIALCTNISGKNKVTPFIIHNDETQDTVSLPCRFHKDAKMDQKLFIDWFENYFKPSAEKHQRGKDYISSQVILFIADRKTYTISSEYLNDKDYEIRYIPKRTASLIQPMDCGIMKSIKRFYRYHLLCRVQREKVNNFYESYSLNDCVDILRKSWKSVALNDIKHAWLKILPCLAAFYIITPPSGKIFKMLRNVIHEITEDKMDRNYIMKYIFKSEEAESKNEEQSDDSIIDSE